MADIQSVRMYALEREEISIPQLQSAFGIDYGTAKSLVDSLVGEGKLLFREGVTYAVIAKDSPEEEGSSEEDEEEEPAVPLEVIQERIAARRRLAQLHMIEKNIHGGLAITAGKNDDRVISVGRPVGELFLRSEENGLILSDGGQALFRLEKRLNIREKGVDEAIKRILARHCVTRRGKSSSVKSSRTARIRAF